ncbi:MAG: neutral/alkaline non-lysosomal ceramidase N-terminal domain-containing protein [Prolixibacteraceae bacterium]|nr:neutral/alkaline non-lysosomal ceramidase N-terminal domain-containing protein [Prolixibacteraceae bacterium]
MKKLISILFIPFFIFFFYNDTNAAGGWKAGTAKAVITPQEPVWMAGYASRNHPSEGVLVDIWAKALALEDDEGNRAVLITTDVIGMRGAYMPNRIRARLKTKYGLSDSQVIISSSHTHTGPELAGDPADYLDEPGLTGQQSPEQREKIRRYSEKLEDQIVDIIGKALNSMEPVKLYSGQGVTRFAVNRRNHRAKTTVNELTQALAGPVDHSVPVFKVEKNSGELLAVVFGYACHNTTIGIYQFSGDYAGFAQIELENEFPGATAMFFAGTGADQNPLPRGNVSYARQYGKELAAAVEAVVSEPMKELSPELSTAWSKVDLGYANPVPTEKDLVKMIEERSVPDYLLYKAKVYLQQLRQGKTLPQSYAYPVQFWRIGEQNMVILGSEVVVDYAVRLKQIFGKDLFVMAYANEVIGYIPSTRVLSEGDYEGTRSYIFTTPWAPDIEMKIIMEALKVAGQAGVKPQIVAKSE